jgi:hypothetical protein
MHNTVECPDGQEIIENQSTSTETFHLQTSPSKTGTIGT